MESSEKVKEKLGKTDTPFRAEPTSEIEIKRGWESLSISKKVIRKIIKEAKEELKEELEEEMMKELKGEIGRREEEIENMPTVKPLKKVWDNEKDDEVWGQY